MNFDDGFFWRAKIDLDIVARTRTFGRVGFGEVDR